MERGDRIQKISAGDAAVLRASHIFPTLADALAQVLQVGLPALEYAIVLHCFPRARRGESDLAVKLSLSSLAWDITHVTTLYTPPHAGASPLRDDTGRGRVPLDLFDHLATICEELAVEAHLCVHNGTTTEAGNSGRRSMNSRCPGEKLCESVSASSVTIPLLPVRRWRRGVALVPGDTAVRYPEQAQCRGSAVQLVAQCRVRGLFLNLPVRRTPFACGIRFEGARCTHHASRSAASNDETDPSFRTAGWVGNTASAARTRREQQQRVLTVCFQAAVCTVLAPLYLSDPETEDREGSMSSCAADGGTARQPASRFTATFADDKWDSSSCVERRTTTHFLRQRRSASAPRTEAHLAMSPCDGGWVARSSAALLVDGYGVLCGAIRVAQAGTQPHTTAATAAAAATTTTQTQRHRTVGERTAEQLCDAFNAWPPPPPAPARFKDTRRTHSAYIAHSSHEDAVARDLIEVVVRPGEFAVLFSVPPRFSQSTPPAPAAAAAGTTSSAQRATAPLFYSSAVASVAAADGAAASVIILVRRSWRTQPPATAGEGDSSHLGVSRMFPGVCCVLESAHWAYDVVASLTQRAQHARRRGHGLHDVVAPVFLFVDAACVPEHLYQARQRGRGDSTTAYHRFADLFTAALERAKGGSDCASARDVDASGARCEEVIQQQTSASANDSVPVVTQSLSSTAPTCSTGSPPQSQTTAQVEVRLRYLSQRVLEAAGASGALSCRPLCAAASTTSSGGLHRVRLQPASLLPVEWRGVGAAHATAACRPRRTPVSLDPHLHRVLVEEEAVLARTQWKPAQDGVRRATAAEPSPQSRDSTTSATLVSSAMWTSEGSTTATGLARMRRLLDTGRGSVLRRLPRAFAQPTAWSPPCALDITAGPTPGDRVRSATAVHVAPPHLPPIGAALTHQVSVTQWARKFLVLAGPSKAAAAPASPPRTPHARQWWVADQHAVHERVRLEFLLCFADTYVCHPELPPVWHRGTARTETTAVAGATAVLSCEAREALQRRHRIAHLLRSLAERRGRSTCSPGSPAHASVCGTSSPAAAQCFHASLPADLRHRVAAVEVHLRQWGWRLEHAVCSAAVAQDEVHGAVSPGTVTAVTAWPRLEVEGVVWHITSLEALRHTVEELEAVGAAAAPCATIVPSVFLELFVSRSCRGAVMFGDRLQPSAARCMMAALDCVEQYYVCSHGRPSFATLRAAV